jgi:hypothetical protein
MVGLTREEKARREAERNGDTDQGDGDERIVRSSGLEVRGERGFEEDPARADPNAMTDFEQLIENEFEQSALPNPPPLPGWHLVWLTSASQYDSIQKRQRLGYQPVKQAEMPGFDPSNGQALERFPGFVTCNEMVLFKIEEQKYQAIMRHFHHKKPMQEEEGIVAQIEAAQREQGGSGKRGRTVVEGDGMDVIADRVQQDKRANPTFS